MAAQGNVTEFARKAAEGLLTEVGKLGAMQQALEGAGVDPRVLNSLIAVDKGPALALDPAVRVASAEITKTNTR